MVVYKRIRELREDNDLLQRQVAEALGITQRQYSHYECGTRMLTPEVLIGMAVFYDVSADYILGTADDPRHFRRPATGIDPA